MASPLRVLILEDRQDDIDLLTAELRQAGFEPSCQCAATEADYLACLRPDLDIILADYALPQFDSLQALAHLHARGFDIPFIVVTGSISEEVAVECIKRGAADYLIKDRLARLGSAVAQALEKKRLRDAQRRAEDALRASEERFRHLLESVQDYAIYSLDSDGRVVSWNAGAERITGYGAAEIMGQHFSRFAAPAELPAAPTLETVRNRQSLTPVQPEEALASAARDGRFHEESWRLRKDGLLFWAEIVWTALREDAGQPGGFVIVERDITERKRMEEALRESSQFNQQIITTVSEGIIVYDRALRYLVWNPYMEELSGLKEHEVLGRQPWDLFPFIRAHGIDELLRRALAGETTSAPDIMYSVPSTGKSGWTSARYGPLRNVKGEVIGAIGTVRDISARKQAEESRRQLEAQIQHAQKLESLGVLAGGIAHDFNNLLTGILGNASLALVELPPESPVRANVQQIETAALRAADLTRQMLAYSGKGRFVVQTINLSQVVEEMAGLLQTVISKRAVPRYDFAPDLPAIEADPTQVRQIVMNLITNASDALGDKSGVVAIRTGIMEVDRAYLATTYTKDELPEGKYVFLEVADTGCGMDEATRARIFDPFFTTKFTGRGLGLAAVLGIVRGHRGSIKVYSEPGRGTTFKVLFPSGGLGIEPGAAASRVPERWRGTGTILVIDDEETVRTVAVAMLERAGFRVLLAHDGRHALELFQRHKTEIVVVLVDLTMSHPSGAEIFRELRLLQPDVRVILMSGYSEQEVTGLFAGKGLAGFVQKPFRVEDLLLTVRRALEGYGDEGDEGGRI